MQRSALGAGPEFDILRRIIAAQRAGDTDGRVIVGPGDDCAVVRGGSLALTVDLAIEGVHFRREWLSSREIGYRSATAAFSDLAAMAALPIGVLAAIAVPAQDAALAEELAAGIEEAAAACGAVVLGGDLSESPGPIVVDAVAVGETDAPLKRDGAVAGDALWVTGSLGGAAVAVAAWDAGVTLPPGARTAFARPAARTAEARWLAERAELHAAIDVSDGIVGDVGHIAAASGVAVVVDLRRVPVNPVVFAFTSDPERVRVLALGGGDDYELCIAAAPGALDALAARFERTFGIVLTNVGHVEEGAGVFGIDGDGRRAPLAVPGYSHFSGKGP